MSTRLLSRSPFGIPERNPRTGDADRGSSTAELVIVTPIIIIMLLLVVAFGRYAYGKQLVEQAASAAARAASLSTTAAQADSRAHQAASASLSDAGVSCTSMSITVDDSDFRAGGTVGATLTCTADLSGLALAGLPGSVTISATGRAPLEQFRQFTGTGTGTGTDQ
jgi:Flp pilus assembly protein TadG